eukprot:993605-Ditylum_brightwellii.AAC.1
MATSTDIPLDLDIQFGTDPVPKLLKRKEPFKSTWQLGLKNNPAADYTAATKDKTRIGNAI